MTEQDLNGELEAVLEFVAQDNAAFDVRSFIENWPKEAKAQRIAQAALSVRNGRELSELTNAFKAHIDVHRQEKKSNTRLWIVSTSALAAVVAHTAYQAGFDFPGAIAGAMIGMAMGALFRFV